MLPTYLGRPHQLFGNPCTNKLSSRAAIFRDWRNTVVLAESAAPLYSCSLWLFRTMSSSYPDLLQARDSQGIAQHLETAEEGSTRLSSAAPRGRAPSSSQDGGELARALSRELARHQGAVLARWIGSAPPGKIAEGGTIHQVFRLDGLFVQGLPNTGSRADGPS